jgi:hypothetical protein
MCTTTIKGTIELTGSVLEDTNNNQYKFKLRMGIQLLEIIEKRYNAASRVLGNCDIDRQVRANLRELGDME